MKMDVLNSFKCTHECYFSHLDIALLCFYSLNNFFNFLLYAFHIVTVHLSPKFSQKTIYFSCTFLHFWKTFKHKTC